MEAEPAIYGENITFSYASHLSEAPVNVLDALNLNVPSGAAVVLSGANGAGKTTLLRVLSGSTMCGSESVLKIFGKACFADTSLNLIRTFISGDWGLRDVVYGGFSLPLQADIAVEDMRKKIQQRYPERARALQKVLRVNMRWRMSCVSAGQRRRVQLYLNLIEPFRLLLLDEVTTDLDLLCRMELLDWLKSESTEQGATIVYATHLFEGLDSWASHLIHLRRGKIVANELVVPEKPIFSRVLEWLKEDRELETQEEEEADGTLRMSDPLLDAQRGAGGFAAGRFYDYWGK